MLRSRPSPLSGGERGPCAVGSEAPVGRGGRPPRGGEGGPRWAGSEGPVGRGARPLSLLTGHVILDFDSESHRLMTVLWLGNLGEFLANNFYDK